MRNPTTLGVLLASCAALAVPAASTTAVAATTGNGAPSGAHYNLNVIGVPKGKTAPMTGTNRHTIFVPLSGGCAVSLVVGDFGVKDGNCTDGKATFSLPNPDADGDGTTSYSVFSRALGTPGGSSNTTTCAVDPYDGSTICSETSMTLTRTAGRQQFSNVSRQLLYLYADYDADGDRDRLSLFDDRLGDWSWQYDNSGLRLAQLRFYQCASTVPAASDPAGPTTSDC